MLHQFIADNRDEIIKRARTRLAERMTVLDAGADPDYVVVFLNQLIETLRLLLISNEELGKSATLHGSDLLRWGFSIGRVVHGYGDVCQIVTAMALERHEAITTDEFRRFNHCLDEALAHAVTEYARQREQSIVNEGTERLGYLAHELRNLLNKALLSFEVLKRGSVGMSGSTSELLGRSLIGLRDLIDRSLTEVRLGARVEKQETLLLAELIEELEIAAVIEAKARGVQFSVSKIEYDIKVRADRALLGSAVGNLLQNAFKFTHPHGSVVLRARTSADRVLIEVEDECGGLTTNPEDLFVAFEQRGQDRSGLGLGLSICRRVVEAISGKIYARNLPGKGCIFTIDLPRSS